MKKLLFLLPIILLGAGCDNLGGGNFSNRQEIITQLGTVTSITTSTASANILASEVCGVTQLTLTSNSSTQATRGTVFTLPSITTLFSSCLASIGRYVEVMLINGGTITSTQIVAGTGGTIYAAPSGVYASSTISPADAVIITLLRDSDTTYKARIN